MGPVFVVVAKEMMMTMRGFAVKYVVSRHFVIIRFR